VQSIRVKAVFAQTIRKNHHTHTASLKMLAYTDNRLALEEARSKGADDALILNTDGALAGATTANVFVKTGEAIYTPPLEDGAMDGVTRAAILSQGLAQEKRLRPDDIDRASAIFLSSSLTGIRAVVDLEGKKLDSDEREISALFPDF
jgi:branched-subunit amino acid aminotransferase/4-amino-4-deoxychorismate lyase